MKLRFTTASMVLAAGATIAIPAIAAPITWNTNGMFSVSAGNPGTSLNNTSYALTNSANQSITAESVVGIDFCTINCGVRVGPAPDLYAKNGGPGETGLGLTGLSNSEIRAPYGIELDLGNLRLSSVSIGSIQSGETWGVWGGNNDAGWTLLGGGSGGASGDTVTFSGRGANNVSNFGDLVISSYNSGTVDSSGWVTNGNANGNIVLAGATPATSVPEPGTLGLMGFALIGTALAKRKRKA